MVEITAYYVSVAWRILKFLWRINELKQFFYEVSYERMGIQLVGR
jgi:hypothetical protein